MKKILQQPVLYFLIVLIIAGACQQKTPGKEQGTLTPDAVEKPEDLEGAEEALRQAALDGRTQQVRDLIARGVVADVTDAEGHTPLMFSAFNGHSAIVLVLLANGAEIDRVDQLGRTALLYASTGPFPETVRILLDKGADPNIVDTNEHFTPLMHAAAEGNLEVVKVLVEFGADPALTDVDGDNAETFARQAGHREVAEYLHALL
jgi:ankyrin repeat protein